VAAVAWAAIACLVVVTVLAMVTWSVDAYRATHGGTVGTFVPGRQSCSTYRVTTTCVWYGTFTSADGATRVEEVMLDESLGTAEGDPPPAPVSPVVYGGASDVPKAYRPGSVDWVLVPALGIAWLGVMASLARRVELWRRRHTQARVRSAAPAHRPTG